VRDRWLKAVDDTLRARQGPTARQALNDEARDAF